MRLYSEKDNSQADVTWTDVLDSAYINVNILSTLVGQSRMVLSSLVLFILVRF
jgi:hypothetical protein